MNREVPDESCRKCGGLLLEHSICAKCRGPNQFICRICGKITLQQHHSNCFNEITQTEELLIAGMY